MQGTGNNYVYIDLIKQNIKKVNFSKLAKDISDVNYGVGADGLILICPSNSADAKMIMYNKDGSEGMMCGNGIRCVGKYLYENIISKKNLVVETESGLKTLEIKTKNNKVTSVVVDMGFPILKPNLIPVLLNDEKIINKEFSFEGYLYNISCVSMGNPHTVIFVSDVDKVDVRKIGNLIQKNKIFPNKCNVSFIQVINKSKIKMRVWEIGSGETYSCGTGACASVVVGVLNGYLKENTKIEVDVLGGKLYITYNDKVYLEGPAETICVGKYEVR